MEQVEYKIKAIPDDFLVEEVIDINRFITGAGDYAYLKITKRNRNTMDVAEELSVRVKKPLKDIGFCGNKDKNALTTQYFSVKRLKKESAESLELKDCKVELLGYGPERLSLGMHEGNRFKITMRSLDPKKVVSADFTGREIQFPNYYGPQRFGSNNAEIGRQIIKKDNRKAISLLCLDFPRLSGLLEKNPNDLVGAIRSIPKRKVILFLHSYQAYLWNKALSEYIQQETREFTEVEIGKSVLAFPSIDLNSFQLKIPGFDIILGQDKVSEIYKKVFFKDGISPQDFIIRSMPDYSLESGERNAFIAARIDSYLKSDDELFPEKSKIMLSFSLPKGSYATVLMQKIAGLLAGY